MILFWTIAITEKKNRLLLLQHVGVLKKKSKQPFHGLKQMLFLIVAGNGQRIEHPWARRMQVAFSKVDLMCFLDFFGTCQQLTVLH